MQTSVSIEIDRPIEEVFDFANNHVAEWSITVVEDEIIEETPEHVGTTFRVLTEEKGRQMEFQGIVTRYNSPTDSAGILRGKYFDIEVDYQFEDLSGRTRMTQQSTIRGKGFFRVFFFLFGWMMKKSGRDSQESELVNLKKIMESQAAEPAQS